MAAQASPEQNHCHSLDAIPQLQKRGTIIYQYDKLFVKILT